MNIDYTVSVRLMTYNHAHYIREAMDSILMQKTTFPVEVVVGDDFSTDGTLDIINEYKDTKNFYIKVLERNIGDSYWKKRKEIGRIYNFYNILENCNGKYIALLDGDDSWLDPLKLQKQVDFLETHSDYTFACGGYTSVNSITKERKEIIKNSPIDQTLASDGFDIIFQSMRKSWLTKTLTTVFRKSKLDLDIFLKYKYARDINLFYHLAKAGKGYYFKEVFGIYNIHEGGINSLKKGKINSNAAYNSYSEIYKINKDSFSREMAIRSTLNLLNYDLFNSYEENTIQKRITLIKESVRLIRTGKEVRFFLQAFIPASVKKTLKK